MPCQQLIKTIDELNETYIAVWEDVCNIESPTAYKAGVDAVGQYCIRLAEEHGWAVEVAPQTVSGDAICITMNPDAAAAPITFSAHMDTVHPVGLFGTPAVHRDDTYIYGPGVVDCKGGVVACLMAMDALQRCGFTARPVQLVLQSDEENSSRTSGKETIRFMCRKAKGSVAFLNAEGFSDGNVVLTRNGIARYKLTVHGKAAHSSRCELGANAIAEAAHKILKFETVKQAGEFTCNCGVIEGGTVPNAVAEECTFTADFRYINNEYFEKADRMVYEVAEQNTVAGCTCTAEPFSSRPAMVHTEFNQELVAKMNAIYAACGLPKVGIAHGPGGSDAAYTTEEGVPTVDCVGVQGSAIHSVREKALLSSLGDSAKRMATVAYCI